MATTTVRVTRATRDAITRLAKGRGVSTPELLAELVARHEQDELLRRMNEAYELQAADPAAREAERAERAVWDSTLLDGVERL